MSNLIYTFLIFILTFTILVFIHELGHYLAAIACRVKVEVFSIGFGHKLFEFKDKRQTIWRFATIPLGGFVSMKGEMIKFAKKSKKKTSAEEKEDTSISDQPLTDQTGSLETKNLWQKSFIAFAGPLANWVFCLLLFIVIFKAYGVPEAGKMSESGIGGVVDGYPASISGLEAGDIITKIDDISIANFQELSETITLISKDETGTLKTQDEMINLKITTLRNNQEIVFNLTPRLESGRYIIGVQPPKTVYQTTSLIGSVSLATERTFLYTKLIVVAFFELFQGKGLENIGGPVKIAQISASAASQGMSNYLVFLALFSLNLAILNLLPIPVLDGGHLVYFGLSAIFSEQKMSKIAKVAIPIGIAILLALTIIIVIKDIITI